MGSEDYVRVCVEFVRTNKNSFIVLNQDGEETVVGRSCVSGIDEPSVAKTERGEEVEFRVMRWLAEKEGLNIV